MSRERDLLQTALGILEDYEWGYGGDHHKSPEASILNDIRKLLAQPEQTKRSPLTEAEISKTLKLSRRSTEWDYGFEAGVRFAEEFHGIEL